MITKEERAAAIAEICLDKGTWCFCGDEAVNGHTSFCDKLNKAIGHYGNAKLAASRIQDPGEAHVAALEEHEEFLKEEVTPGQQLNSEVNDWTDMLREAQSKNWDLSEEKAQSSPKKEEPLVEGTPS